MFMHCFYSKYFDINIFMLKQAVNYFTVWQVLFKRDLISCWGPDLQGTVQTSASHVGTVLCSKMLHRTVPTSLHSTDRFRFFYSLKDFKYMLCICF